MFLAVDIGGTNTRVAISNDGQKILKKIRYPSPQKYDDGIDRLQEAIEEITEGKIPKLIIVDAASPIDYEKGILMRPPNLPKWAGHSFRKELEIRLRTKVMLENDGALAALAEAHLEKRKKHKIVAYITLSTGLGGARIVNGRIDYHAQPFEPGHIILDPNGRFWPGCGQKGCFESICSGRAFEMTYDVKPENCGDTRIWEEHARHTSQGLLNVIVLWSPEILVLGGSLVKAGPKFIKPLLRYTKQNLKILPMPKIEVSKLDDNNALLGGFILLSQKDYLTS